MSQHRVLRRNLGGDLDALREARQFGCAVPDQQAFIEGRAAAPKAPVAPTADRPTEEVLSETAAMNKDPMGLDRALASLTTSLGSAAGGAPGAFTNQLPSGP